MRLFDRWRILTTVFFIVFLLVFLFIFLQFPDFYLLQFVIGIALFFIYYIVTVAFLYRLEFLMKLERLGDRLEFKKDFHILRTPKLVGKYKGHKFKIEYWYKSTGKSPFRIRTYIKMYLNDAFHLPNLDKYKNIDNFKVIAFKYNEEKNYLLLKIRGDIIIYDQVKQLMEHIIKVPKK